MTCKKCGKCCRTLIIPGDAYTKEDEELISMRKGFEGKVKFKGEKYFIFDAPCTYLKSDNTCGIHKDRPDLCKKFPGPAFSEFWKIINPKCGELK